MTVASVIAGAAVAAACTAPPDAALRAGRDAAAPCIERFHDQGHTYAACVRYVAAQRRGADAAWQRLGALTAGWVTADLAARQTADVDASLASRTLLAEADALQQELRLGDAPLCALVAQTCTQFRGRRTVLRASGNG